MEDNLIDIVIPRVDCTDARWFASYRAATSLSFQINVSTRYKL